MKKYSIYLSMLSIAILSGCGNQYKQSKTDIAIPVSVSTVSKGSISSYVNTSGTAYASKETSLTTEIDGDYFLTKNPRTGKIWKMGDQIHQGEILIEIKDNEYVNTVALDSKKLDKEISEMEYTKQQSLYKKGGVTYRELKDAEIATINTQYSYELAKEQLQKMKIIAPFSGVITELPRYTNGGWIATGTEVATLMNYNKLFLEIQLPEKYISDVSKQQRAEVFSYSLPNDTLHGVVSQISPAIDVDTRTFSGEIEIDNTTEKLHAGMYVNSNIQINNKQNVIVIPKDIILSDKKGKKVFVVQRGAAEQRIIKTGLENKDSVEIVSGLKEKDRLITSGYETLKNRSKIKIIK